MKLTKQILLSLLAGVVALAVFTACDGGTTDPSDGDSSQITTTTAPDENENKLPEVHTHAPKDGWQIDGVNHWRLCACGEVMEKSAHTIQDNVCTGCESEVLEGEDGSMSIWQFNEHGSAVLKLDYDADGNLTHKETGDFLYNEDGLVLSELYTQYPRGEFPESSRKNEYTYGEEGRCLSEKRYSNGMLYYECEYALDADGDEYVSKDILYNYYNGTKLVNEYDENAERISSIWYSIDGKELDQSGKFDAEACKDLFGAWQTELDLGELIFQNSPVPEEFRVSCKADIILTFQNDGTFLAEIEIDPDEYKTLMIELAVETLYVGAEEAGMTRAEADAYFESYMGMPLREYVEANYTESEDALPEDTEGVYYVEKGKVCFGEGWDQPLEGSQYTLNGDALTLTVLRQDLETEMKLVFTKIAD